MGHLQDVVYVINFLELIFPILSLAQVLIAQATLPLTNVVLLQLHCQYGQKFLDYLSRVKFPELLYDLDDLINVHLFESFDLALFRLDVVLALVKIDVVEFLLEVGDVVDESILILLEFLTALIHRFLQVLLLFLLSSVLVLASIDLRQLYLRAVCTIRQLSHLLHLLHIDLDLDQLLDHVIAVLLTNHKVEVFRIYLAIQRLLLR